MPNYYNAKAVGLSFNGVYHPFATTVSIDADYPYTHPNYLNGIQYQIFLVTNRPFTWTVTPQTLTKNLYELSFLNCKQTVDYIKLLLNDNYTLVDVPLSQQNCATVGSPRNVEYFFSPDPSDPYPDYFSGGAFYTTITNSLYGCKFIIPNADVTQCTISQIFIDGVKHVINLPFTAQISQIEFALNSIGKGNYTVTRFMGDMDTSPYFQVNKVNRDNHVPNAMSLLWTGNTAYTNANGNVEIARAFEVLDVLTGEVVNTPIYQTADDNCLTEDEYQSMIVKAKAICPDCC